MITAASMVLLAIACPTPVAPSDGPAPITESREYRVRTLDSRVRDWLSIGASRSRTFAALLDRLATSDLIVYVDVVGRIPAGVGGQLSFVTTTRAARYLRVELVSAGTTNEMVALLGHELQHAVEIADAPRVTDSQTMATMYLYLGGLHTERSRLDSEAARLTGGRVKAELESSRGANTSTAFHSPRPQEKARTEGPSCSS